MDDDLTDEQPSDASSALPEVALPDAEDRVFANGGQDWRSNAVLMQGFGDRWYVYATGYRRAADIVVANVTTQLRDQDFLVYPIMFLYRQYLELTIKSLIRSAWRLLDEEESDPLRSHDINRYWGVCQALLVRISPGGLAAVLEDTGRLIAEFCEHDPASDAFRYPESAKREPTLSNLEKVNLRNVQVVMGKIADLLDGADAMIDAYMDSKAEMRFYYDPGDYGP